MDGAGHLHAVPLFPAEGSAQGATVCVTGATGYVASTLVQRLLLAGAVVHATVRDPTRGVAHLQDMPGAAQRLKLFQADLTDTQSFDAAVADCSVVFHTASPFKVNIPQHQVAEQLLRPAVKGTEAVLGAATRAGSVRRVVLTSSVAAVYGDAWDRGAGHVFTEHDWNESSSEASMPYAYSKVLAEKRAWELAAAQDRWDLVAICPALVLGPPLSPRADGESVELVAKICRGDFWPAVPTMGFGVQDVRVVAAAHCLAAFTPHASGRYIVVGHDVWFRDIAATAARLFCGRIPRPLLPAPTPLLYCVSPAMGVPRDVVRRCFGKLPLHDSSRVKADLGLDCASVSLEDSLSDMVLALAKHGVIRRVPKPGTRGLPIVWKERIASAVLDWPLQNDSQEYAAPWKDTAAFAHECCKSELGRVMTDKELLKLAQATSCLKVKQAGTRDCTVALDVTRLQLMAARADTSGGWSTVGMNAVAADPAAAVSALSSYDSVTVALCACAMALWPKKSLESTCMRHISMACITAPASVWGKYGQYKGTVWGLTVPCVQAHEWWHSRPRPQRVDTQGNIKNCQHLMQTHAGSFSRPYFTFFRLKATTKGPDPEGQLIAQLQVEAMLEDVGRNASASSTSLTDLCSTLTAVMDTDKGGFSDQVKPFIAKLKPIVRSPTTLAELLKRAQKELPSVFLVKTGARHNVGVNRPNSGDRTEDGFRAGGGGGGGSASSVAADEQAGEFEVWDEDFELMAGMTFAEQSVWAGDEGQLAALYLAACAAFPSDAGDVKTGVQLCALLTLLGAPPRAGHTPHSALLSALVRPCRAVMRVLQLRHHLEAPDLDVPDILRSNAFIHVPRHTKDPVVQLRLPELAAVAVTAAAGASAQPPVTTPVVWPPCIQLQPGVIDALSEGARSMVDRALGADLQEGVSSQLPAALEVLRSAAQDADPDAVRTALTALGAIRLTLHTTSLTPNTLPAARASARRAASASAHQHTPSGVSSASARSTPMQPQRTANAASASEPTLGNVPAPSEPPTPSPREPEVGSSHSVAPTTPTSVALAASTAAHIAVRPPPGFGPLPISPNTDSAPSPMPQQQAAPSARPAHATAPAPATSTSAPPAPPAAPAAPASSGPLQVSNAELAAAVGEYLESQDGSAAAMSDAELLAKVKGMVLQRKLKQQGLMRDAPSGPDHPTAQPLVPAPAATPVPLEPLAQSSLGPQQPTPLHTQQLPYPMQLQTMQHHPSNPGGPVNPHTHTPDMPLLPQHGLPHGQLQPSMMPPPSLSPYILTQVPGGMMMPMQVMQQPGGGMVYVPVGAHVPVASMPMQMQMMQMQQPQHLQPLQQQQQHPQHYQQQYQQQYQQPPPAYDMRAPMVSMATPPPASQQQQQQQQQQTLAPQFQSLQAHAAHMHQGTQLISGQPAPLQASWIAQATSAPTAAPACPAPPAAPEDSEVDELMALCTGG